MNTFCLEYDQEQQEQEMKAEEGEDVGGMKDFKTEGKGERQGEKGRDYK